MVGQVLFRVPSSIDLFGGEKKKKRVGVIISSNNNNRTITLASRLSVCLINNEGEEGDEMEWTIILYYNATQYTHACMIDDEGIDCITKSNDKITQLKMIINPTSTIH